MEQIIVGLSAIIGLGLTGINIVKTVGHAVAPTPIFAVTVYSAVATAEVTFVNVWLIDVWGIVWILPPIIALAGEITGVVHV